MGRDDEIDISDVGKGEEIGVEVEDWLASKKGFPKGILTGTVEATTKKAVLIDEEWIPKSQVLRTWLL